MVGLEIRLPGTFLLLHELSVLRLFQNSAGLQKGFVIRRTSQKFGQVVGNVVGASRSEDHFPVFHAHSGIHDALGFKSRRKHVCTQNLGPHVSVLHDKGQATNQK